MRYIIFSIFLIISHNALFAGMNFNNDLQALFFNDEINKDEALKFAKQHDLKYVAFLQEENVMLVSQSAMNILSEIKDISYSATVQQSGLHLAIPKNEILVKTIELDVLYEFARRSDVELLAHDFIPNLFTLSLLVNNNLEVQSLLDKIPFKDPNTIAEVNFIHTLEVTASVNDPLFIRQWSIENTGSSIQGGGIPDADMQVDSAWDITTGDINLKIGILDSGVDTLHEDLMDNLLPGFDGFADNNSDTKGYPTPNFSNDGHGTACAGIVAAEGNNGIGVAGVSYSCKLVPIRLFYYQDYGPGIGVQATTNTNAMINAAGYAWREANVDIMSTSAGLSNVFIAALGVSTELVNAEIGEAFNDGRNGRGVAMFFSAGNDDIADVLWPAELPTTIAIGASSMCDERKNPLDCSTENWGSSYGPTLDVVAPGTLIASTDMTGGNGYSGSDYTNTFNGTSAACPNAAGVGALILAMNSTLHARDVKAILNLTADKVSGYAYDSTTLDGTWNEEVGHGRVNAYNAVQLAPNYASTVSIDDFNIDDELSIYPNPVNDRLTVEFSREIDFVRITDRTGRLMSQIALENGQTQLNIDLPNGIYIMQVGYNGQTLGVSKFTVLK